MRYHHAAPAAADAAAGGASVAAALMLGLRVVSCLFDTCLERDSAPAPL